MDCFATLAMTVQEQRPLQKRSPSRRGAPEALKNLAPFRGRGECRMRAAPAVPCAIVIGKNAHEHTGSAEAIRPSLRNGFTAYSALSPVSRALLPPSLRRSLRKA